MTNYYHIYNRGAHKAPIFNDKSDYERFLILLYKSNDSSSRRVGLRDIKKQEMFRYIREPLVEIFTYCLMPNHFHIGLNEITEKGMEKFIHKLCTSYSMYYNNKYDHSGTIFQGQYKRKHIDNDDYFRYLIQYIHLNPFGIEEPHLMKEAKSDYLEEAIKYSKEHEYSSYKDYLGIIRPQNSIISRRPTLRSKPAG